MPFFAFPSLFFFLSFFLSFILSFLLSFILFLFLSLSLSLSLSLFLPLSHTHAHTLSFYYFFQEFANFLCHSAVCGKLFEDPSLAMFFVKVLLHLFYFSFLFVYGNLHILRYTHMYDICIYPSHA